MAKSYGQHEYRTLPDSHVPIDLDQKSYHRPLNRHSRFRSRSQSHARPRQLSSYLHSKSTFRTGHRSRSRSHSRSSYHKHNYQPSHRNSYRPRARSYSRRRRSFFSTQIKIPELFQLKTISTHGTLKITLQITITETILKKS